jgi:hypothetical protein
VALVKLVGDRVVLAHTQVEIAARAVHDLTHELIEDPPTSPVELTAVEDLVQHDRASRNSHVANAGAFLIFLPDDDDAALIDALVPLDAAFESVLPDVREHIPVGLKLSVDRLEIAQTRVSHELSLSEDENGFAFEGAFSKMLESHHFAQLELKSLDQMPAIVLRVSEKDPR